MNFDDDFDENINKLIKWLTVVSIAAIILWAVIGIFKFLFPNIGQKHNEEALVKENPTISHTIDNNDIINDLLDGDSAVNEKSLILDEDKAVERRGGGKKFTVHVKELPDTLYFPELNSDNSRERKKAIINKKVGDNYIDSVLSYGTLVRWNPENFPLKVYISLEENLPQTYINEIKNAFQMWQNATKDFISFTYVENKNDADIICTCSKSFIKQCDKELPVLSKQYFTYDKQGHIKNANIDLASSDCNDEAFAQDMIYALALREIGHSLGLRGHSGSFQDKVLYYPKPDRYHSVRPEINSGDINTLRLIYSVMPDKTNTDLSEEQRKKLINPDEVWGETIDRSSNSESAILYNIEQSPEIPTLYVALANYYKERREYDKALSIYNRSIVLMNDAEFKARVYARVGDIYNTQKQYGPAIEAYKISLKTLNNKKDKFNVYYNLGFIYYTKGQTNEALASFQLALNSVSNKEDFFKLLMNMAQIYMQINDRPKAQKCAEKALSIARTKDSLYLNALICYNVRDFETAEKYLKEIMENKTTMEAITLLGKIYYVQKRFDELDALGMKAREKFTSNPPFTYE